MTDQYLPMATASRRLGYPARTLSDAVYCGVVNAEGWPRVGNVRLVPVRELEAVGEVLRAWCSRRRKRQPAEAQNYFGPPLRRRPTTGTPRRAAHRRDAATTSYPKEWPWFKV